MIVREFTKNGYRGEELIIDIEDPVYTSTVAEFIGQHPFAVARDRVERRAQGAKTLRIRRVLREA